MTTDDRLAEIRQRLTNATPGPWEVNLVPHVYQADAPSRDQVFETPRDDSGRRDAELIAHAPDDLAWLLDQLTAAHDTIERLDQQHDEAIDSVHEMQARLDAVWQVIKPGPDECGGCPPEGWTSEAWNARLDALVEVRRTYTDIPSPSP